MSKLHFGIRQIMACIYFFVSLFLLAFVNFDGATTFLAMVVPHIEGHVVVIHFMLSVAVLLLFFLGGRTIKLDVPTICLFLKCWLDALPFLNSGNNSGEYFWHYACTLVAFISYIIYVNSGVQRKNIVVFKKILILFGIVLAVQVIYTYFNMSYAYTDLRYKNAMVIPYGGTNIISSILIPILIIVFYSVDNQYKRWICIIFLEAAVILTKSRGGILLSVSSLLFLEYMNMDKSKYRALRRFMLIVSIILTVVALLGNNLFIDIFSGYSSVSSGNTILEKLTSGRVKMWTDIITETFKGNFLFGVGMYSLTGNTSGAHNIIIDLIYKCGIIGTINYVIMLAFFLKRGKMLWRAGNKAIFAAVVALLVNSLFEVCYFSYSCDAMFFCLSGIMMREYYLSVNKT